MKGGPTAAFELALREDGSLDPACLERMGERWIAQWLRDRLGGRDPYIPIDQRTDEDPEALVVDLLRAGRALRHLFSGNRPCRSCPLGRRSPGRSRGPPVFSSPAPTLRAGAHDSDLYLVSGRLTALSRNPAPAECRWGSAAIIEEILFAARRQTPGLPESPAHDLWLGLLRQPRFATMALLGLGLSFARLVAHLPVWWRTSPSEEKSRALGEIVFQALSAEGETPCGRPLQQLAPAGSLKVEGAVDRELQANGLTSSLSRARAAHVSATLNAGWKREEHLTAA